MKLWKAFVVVVALVACADETPIAPSGGNIGRAEPVAGEGGFQVLLGEPGSGESAPRSRERGRLFLVLDAPYQSWADEGTYVHLAAFDGDFEPAAGAAVFQDGVHVGDTDEHGTLVFRQQPEEGAERPAGGELLVVHGRARRRVSYSANARTRSFEQPTIYVQTDRGVYQPGQTMRVRAVAWRLRGEYEPLPDQDVALELVDGEDRVVGGGLLKTDEWGVATLDMPLPRHAPEGDYKLVAVQGPERAEAFVRIERFVPPTIEIQHDLPRFMTPRTERLPFEVRLGYFGGGEFRSGHLTAELRVGEQSIRTLEQAVTGPGPHALAFEAPMLERLHQLARSGRTVSVKIEVTDSDRRRDHVRREIRYEANPYRAVLELDRTRYAPGEPIQAMLRLVDLDDTPVRGREVTLETWNEEALTATTDEGGVARFSLEAPDEVDRFLSLRARIDDVAHPIAYADVSVREPLPMRSAVEDTSVPQGSEIPVEILFPTDVSPVERVVHADVVDSSGGIIHSFLVPIGEEDGHPIARTTVTTPGWGSMLLTLFCLGRKGGEVGLVTDGQNLVVTPGERLTMTLRGLPEQAAPGDELAFDVAVQDTAGAPVEALLGVSVVDRAVISLLDPLELSPFDRFYNPERKVLASTGAQTLTWPVVQRNWGDERHDIGWPPQFGWHGGTSGMEALAEEEEETPEWLQEGSEDDYEGGKGKRHKGEEGAMGLQASKKTNNRYAIEGPSDNADPQMAREAAREMARNAGVLGVLQQQQPGAPGAAQAPADFYPGAAARRRVAPRIVVRTNFDETALWMPRLRAGGGAARVTVPLPDSITVQDVAVLATDRAGGIRLERAQLPVRQSLYARSDLPATLVQGESLEVGVAARNLGDAPVSARVSLRSPDLEVTGQAQEVTIPADGTTPVFFTVRATRAGRASYEVSAEALGGDDPIHDTARRTLFVRPAGEPVTRDIGGAASEGVAFRESFTLAASDRYHVARLSVSLPTVVPALHGLSEIVERGYFGPDPAASRVVAAAAVYRYLERHDQLDTATRERLRSWLSEVATAILLSQNGDGGWGWFWDPGSQPFVSAFALSALLELRELGFSIPERTLREAADYLVRRLDGNGVLPMDAIAPWESDDFDARRAGTAQLFEVLSRLPDGMRRYEYERPLAQMAARFRSYLTRPEADPLTLAYALLAMHRLGRPYAPEAEQMREAARRLADLRHTTHWEPGWFEAYGGTVEAAAASLAVLSELAPDRFEQQKADALAFLLDARGAWGEWHNTRSTAFAVRALLALDPAVDPTGGTLRVLVDGEEQRRVTLRPDNLFVEALPLRSLELEGLPPGAHTVEVRYTGREAARVRLSLSRWTGAPRPESAPELGIQRTAPRRLSAGHPGDLTLRVTATPGVGPVLVSQRLPAAVSAERTSLDALVSAGTVARYERREGEVLLSLVPGEGAELAFRVTAAGAGTVVLPPATATATLRPETVARTGADTVAVGAP